MIKKFAWSLVGVLLPLAVALPGKAETVLEKVARTGYLTVGTRLDMIPYAYVNDKQELSGYSIEVLNRLRTRLESELGKTITLQIVEAKDPGAKINLLKTGDIDIACDTQFTWERNKAVDFSTPYSISGIRLLAKKGSNLSTPESLIGKRIGVVKNSVAESAVKLLQPKADIVSNYTTAEEGIQALKEGKIDAIAGDTISLAGLTLLDNPANYELMPQDAVATYGIACMVPENNSGFLDELNYTIVKMMQEYVNNNPATVASIDQWFGAQGLVPLPPELIRSFFEFTIIEHAQIPPDSK
ncbi:MAG: Glutamate/aspartate import solute-binding protein [Chroococcopsis gigantea SAG 12.99]|jgi:polar amino acid transport system substrate-binding protein|nr:Glutamate/aspartate import solute-binding protein [Chroococcopsis gigantea SAG 12.99]